MVAPPRRWAWCAVVWMWFTLVRGQGMQWQQLAQKLQATPEAALPPRPKIKEPILKYKHVDPPHFMTAPVMDIYKRCKSQLYRNVPKERSHCVPKTCPRLGKTELALELPPPKLLTCTRKDRRSLLAVLLLRPQDPRTWKAVQGQVPQAWAPEAITWQDTPVSKPTEAEKKQHHQDMMLSMRFNFIIYANYFMGVLRPLNRMIKMAKTEMVLVIPGEKGVKSVSSVWLQTAVAAFQMHPSLAMVGMEGFDGVAETGTMEFMHAISYDRPFMVRRSAYLAVGLADTSGFCPDWDGSASKEKAAWYEFNKSLWLHGLSVAALDWEAKLPAASKAGIVDALRRQWPVGKAAPCAVSSTQESARGRGDCMHGPDAPPAAVVVQYFRRPKDLPAMARQLLSMQGVPGVEVMINDDSRSEHAQWMQAFAGAKNFFLVHSPDVHEIRGYNRLGKMANSEMVAFMQDDDYMRAYDWLSRALELFESHPTMALLGGRAGRLDTGEKLEVKGARLNVPGYTRGPLWQSDGPKFGMPPYTKLTRMDARTRIPFDFMYKVNASPLILRRSTFLRLGMFNQGFSCPGQAGITFDFEYSIRMWKHNAKVGLYYSYFDDFPKSGERSGGTMSTPEAVTARLVTWRRNNLQLYYMYPNFHHRVGTKFPIRASGNVSAVVPITCRGDKLVASPPDRNRCPPEGTPLASQRWFGAGGAAGAAGGGGSPGISGFGQKVVQILG